MSAARTSLRLVALLGVLPVLASLGCDENILDPMADRQPRAHAYKESVFFADGLSMRAPPEGTVPRERITMNPILTTGREGETGQIAANGERVPAYTKTTQMSLRPPPSLHKYSDRAPGYIFEVISKGFGLMASYAAEMTIEERWAVVAYVRALQISQNAPVTLAPADIRASLEAQPARGTTPVQDHSHSQSPEQKEAP
jgi:hypothetical protein